MIILILLVASGACLLSVSNINLADSSHSESARQEKTGTPSPDGPN